MKMMKKFSFLLTALFFLLYACQKEEDNPEDKVKEIKKLRIYCDESIYNIMKKPLSVFDSIDIKVDLIVTKSSSFEAMKMFLAGECDVILQPRIYSHYEDSMMAVYGVSPHLRMPIAKDALVFFVNYDSPLDTLNDNHIVELLTNKEKSFKNYYPVAKNEPLFVTNSNQSSEVENIYQIITKKKKINRNFKLMPVSDSVKSFMLKNSGNIGVGYYSNIIGDPQFRALPIGFIDTSGKYIFPRTVHQANILQNLYPYVVTYWVYVQDQNNEDAMRFARYISKHPTAQKHFNDFGIVPAYARVNLIDER